MLEQVAFNLTEVLDFVKVRSLEHNRVQIKSSLINWSLIPQYPACQTIDVTTFLDLKKNSPMYLKFSFKKTRNLAISFLIEDKRKALSKRSLRSNTMDYEGDRIEIQGVPKKIVILV